MYQKVKGWYCPDCKKVISCKEKKEYVHYKKTLREGGVVVEACGKVIKNKQLCDCCKVAEVQTKEKQDIWKSIYIEED